MIHFNHNATDEIKVSDDVTINLADVRAVFGIPECCAVAIEPSIARRKDSWNDHAELDGFRVEAEGEVTERILRMAMLGNELISIGGRDVFLESYSTCDRVSLESWEAMVRFTPPIVLFSRAVRVPLRLVR